MKTFEIGGRIYNIDQIEYITAGVNPEKSVIFFVSGRSMDVPQSVEKLKEIFDLKPYDIR